MTDRPRIVTAWLLALSVTLAATPVTAQTDCGVVRSALTDADDAIVVAVDAGRLALAESLDARYDLVDELVRPHFDFEFGSELLLYPYWENASAEQRAAFSTAFYQFLLASFGHLVGEYEHETLLLNGECGRFTRSWGRGFSQSADLKLTGDINDTVRIIFAIREVEPGGIAIFDVQHGGVSQIQHFRGQFAERLATEGLGPLIRFLEEEAQLLREQQLGRIASGAGGNLPDDQSVTP